MKKIIVIICFCAIVAFGLYTCGSHYGKGVVGETYQSNSLEYTIDNIYVSEYIDGWGGANEEMLLPIDENNSNVGKRWSLEEYIAEHGLSSTDSDNALVTVVYHAKNVSKNDYTVRPSAKIDYDNGYEYSTIKMIFRGSDEVAWNDIPNGVTLLKLKENTYEFREVVEVPKQALSDDKDLVLYIRDKKFNLRDYIK